MTEHEKQLLEQCSKDLVEIKELLRKLINSPSSNVVNNTGKKEIPEQISSTLEECTKKSTETLDALLNVTDKEDLEVFISKIFQNIGIPCNLKGYHYLRSAILLSIEDPNMMNSITKKLYPSLANQYQTTPSRVERAIRHAIEKAWSSGNKEYLDSIFGYTVSPDKGKTTNSEFIAMFVDRINHNL